MKWNEIIIDSILNELRVIHCDDIIYKIINNKINIHLGIFREPFSSLISAGSKKIESRFSKNKIVPFGKLYKEDLILMKKPGGPIFGMFIAGCVTNYIIKDRNAISNIILRFGDLICIDYDKSFLERHNSSNYLTLIEIKKFIRIKPITIIKKDRRGWLLIKESINLNII